MSDPTPAPQSTDETPQVPAPTQPPAGTGPLGLDTPPQDTPETPAAEAIQATGFTRGAFGVRLANRTFATEYTSREELVQSILGGGTFRALDEEGGDVVVNAVAAPWIEVVTL